jgi:hypothetical protein
MQIEEIVNYVAILIAFLLPVYMLAYLYNMIKAKRQDLIGSVKLIVGILIIVAAYICIEPIQRYYIMLMLAVVVFVILVVMVVGQAFKIR